MKKGIIFTLILLLAVYFLGFSFTGFVPLGETCCTGENCDEDSRCTYSQPKIPPQNILNIILEIATVALIFAYIYVDLQQKKKNKKK